MKINLKLALISLVIIFVLTGISGFIVYSVIYPSFAEVQSRQDQRDAARLRGLIQSELETLEGSAENWAKSDTMVTLATRARGRGTVEITPSMLQDVSADIVLIINAEGEVVRSIYYLQSGKKLIVAIPKPLQDLLLPIARQSLAGEERSGFLPCANDFCVPKPLAPASASPTAASPTAASPTAASPTAASPTAASPPSGLPTAVPPVAVPAESAVEAAAEYHIPIMLSARKILPSDRTGDVQGVLVMGRGITRAVHGRYQNELGLKFMLQSASQEFFESTDGGVLRMVPHDNQVTVLQPLRDIKGNQSLASVMTINSDIIKLGLHSVIIVFAATSFIALVAAAVLWFFLRCTVAQPLRILTRQVLEVRSDSLHPSESPDYKSLELREDEIGVLARELMQMLKRLDEMVARLDESRQVAETAYESKSQFLEIITQDLRLPLTAILRLAEAIRANPDGHHDGCRDNAREICNATRLLLAQVNDMLNLANTQVENYKIADEPVNMVTLVQQTVRNMQQGLSAAGIKIHSEFPGDFPAIRGDTDRLRQIILNVLTNAKKFSLPGGKITVKGSHQPATGLVITVRDNGIGIDAQNTERLLSPIKISDSDIARRFLGTGLGLAIAKRLTEAHGGKLRIESEQGQGTVVTLTLPYDRVV